MSSVHLLAKRAAPAADTEGPADAAAPSKVFDRPSFNPDEVRGRAPQGPRRPSSQ